MRLIGIKCMEREHTQHLSCRCQVAAAWKKLQVSFDHNVMLMEQNLQQKEAASKNSCSHLFDSNIYKDISYMMKCLQHS